MMCRTRPRHKREVVREPLTCWLQDTIELSQARQEGAEDEQRPESEQSALVLGAADAAWKRDVRRGLGQLSQAQECLCEALQISVDIRDALTPMYVLPVAALLLADRGQVERAVEIYAMASRYPFVAPSCWFEDIAGREIVAITETLPPEVVAAAQDQGQARDLWATVEGLLDELAADEPGSDMEEKPDERRTP